MKISEMLLPEFDREMMVARELLRRVPVAKADWKPHEKSMTMGRLAGHVAELPGMAFVVMKAPVFDLAARAADGHQPYVPASSEDLLQTFDKNVAEVRDAIAGAADGHFEEIWAMQFGQTVVASGPRLQMYRFVFMNHVIHHRAQLSVYLRLNNIPLPPMYGPSADEGMPS